MHTVMQTEMMRLRQEITTEAEEREWQMREEAQDRDRWLVESLDEREQCTRDWWMPESDRQDEIMLHQMFLMVKDAHPWP